jgi:hypothetical protein
MDKPTISNTDAMFQAGTTAAVYLEKAIKSIDFHLGDGYAAKHPELIAAMVSAQVQDFNNCSLTAAIWEVAQALDRR